MKPSDEMNYLADLAAKNATKLALILTPNYNIQDIKNYLERTLNTETKNTLDNTPHWYQSIKPKLTISLFMCILQKHISINSPYPKRMSISQNIVRIYKKKRPKNYTIILKIFKKNKYFE